MRKTKAIITFLVLIAAVFMMVTMNVSAAIVSNITPSKGKAGHVAIIHGEGFAGQQVTVKFGAIEAKNVDVLNDKVVKVMIPDKNPDDPNTVIVEVRVNEQILGQFPFEYR